MGSQFIRAECYASVRSQPPPTKKKNGPKSAGTGSYGANKTRRGKLSAKEIIKEATRAPDATPHVLHPAPPNCLYGINSEELPVFLTQIEALAAEVKVTMADGRQRKQRTDTPILMGVVASYPSAADENDELYMLWREKTVEFLKEKYGDNLVSVLEHTDEDYGHIHAFVTDKGRSVKPLHDAYAAQAEAANHGASKKAQADAYKNGGRAFQDDFYAKVGVATGLARIGPARPRKTRQEWQGEKQANKAMAVAMLEASKVIGQAEVEKTLVDEAKKKNAARASDLLIAHNDLNAKKDDLAEWETALSAREADVVKKQTLLEQLSKNIDLQKAKLLEAFSHLPSAIQDKLAKIFSVEKPAEKPAVVLKKPVIEVRPIEVIDPLSRAKKIRKD